VILSWLDDNDPKNCASHRVRELPAANGFLSGGIRQGVWRYGEPVIEVNDLKAKDLKMLQRIGLLLFIYYRDESSLVYLDNRV